ncbi:MAG TPA: nuclear transport factor 2 family protein [Pyrinomonadaceae bacterium]|nr:nuclear transport factor 2 family protein [Pyrinomonadaceae bacterium]
MTERDNMGIVRQAYDAFRGGDIQGVLNLLADDVDWLQPGPPDVIPFAGQYRGRDQVGEFFSRLGGAEEAELFEPLEFFASGERVVALGRYRGRVRATGRVNEVEWVHVFTVRGGKIVSHRQYSDTAASVETYRGTPGRAARASS